MPEGFYSIPKKGQARILHTTDVHGQLLPVYFREPNVNLGVGDAFGRPPHIVGKGLLEKMNLPLDGPEAYAYTYLDFYNAAKKYGKMGGFSHLKTLLDMLRKEAGGIENTITIDGGDLWQGSGTSLWTRGVDMVEASNILGVDAMIGHWEFTYNEQEVLSNIALFKGDFIGQNVRVKDVGYAFQPYTMKKVGGKRIAVVGQAFPRTANANPPEFFPDWSFGLREGDMADLVKSIHEDEKPDAVVMLSHNGMDVDIKMAENVPGIDAVFGGHTHDGIPQPLEVKSKDGKICLVTNAGSNGKFVGVMDFDLADGKKNLHYSMKPVFSNWLEADSEMEAYLSQMRKSYDEILTEKLAIADRTLYRRGNFMGTWDQVLCNALRHEYKADISFSAGVRWGTSTLKGDWITMEDVMTQCSMTYAETYTSEITGKALLETLEQIADNLFDPDPYLQSGGDMVRVGGLDYTIDPTKKLYERITDARLDNGDKIEADKSYKLAGWATVNRTPEGRLMWDVARDYILQNKGKDNILKLDKINRPKLVGVNDNPGIADYAGETA
ncbi:UNVERIFIED_CONTAM: hypothetical protein GTU68_065364 [Idotea baltica]|nr:hypothetical protein [Idotea baltica]